MWTHGPDGKTRPAPDLALSFSARIDVLDRLADHHLSTPGRCSDLCILAAGVMALADDWRMVAAAMEEAEEPVTDHGPSRATLPSPDLETAPPAA